MMNQGNRLNTYRNGGDKGIQRGGGGGSLASSFRHSNIRMEDRRAFPSYDDSSQDEDEEEEERRLSDLHGEAEEGGRNENNKNKRKTVEDGDKKIEDQYRKALKQTRKPRPKLTYEILTGSNGLIRLPMELPEQMKRYIPKSGKDIIGAAEYCRILMNSYERFTNDLIPSESYEDTLWKIEQLGSSKQTRMYLQQMRNEQRNKYLENALGKEKSMRVIQDLDDEMARLAQEQQGNDEVQDEIQDNDVQDAPSDEAHDEHHVTDTNGSPMQSNIDTDLINGTSSPVNDRAFAIPKTTSSKKIAASRYHNMYKKNKVVPTTSVKDRVVVDDHADEEEEEKKANFEVDIQDRSRLEADTEDTNDEINDENLTSNDIRSVGNDTNDETEGIENDISNDNIENETAIDDEKQDVDAETNESIDDINSNVVGSESN